MNTAILLALVLVACHHFENLLVRAEHWSIRRLRYLWGTPTSWWRRHPCYYITISTWLKGEWGTIARAHNIAAASRETFSIQNPSYMTWGATNAIDV